MSTHRWRGGDKFVTQPRLRRDVFNYPLLTALTSLSSMCLLGSFSISTGMITAHQLYNYITDHACTYGMKPLRMSKTAAATDAKKGAPDLHEYALVAVWNR